MPFDSTRLIAQMNLKGSLPTGRFSDQELLDFAYDSLLSEICPAVLATREEFFVTSLDYAITAAQASYYIPPRAMNGVLREVKLIRGTQVIDLTRVDLEDITLVRTGTPNSFYVMGNSLVLDPAPTSTADTLRVYYFIRPSKLVPVSECAAVTAIVGNVVTAAIPASWTAADTFDIVRGRGSYEVIGLDLAATSVAAGSITFTATVPSTFQVGDYVCLAGETLFPSLPEEGHVALVQSAVAAALESMGDPGASTSVQKAAALVAKFEAVLKTRIQGAPKQLGRSLL